MAIVTMSEREKIAVPAEFVGQKKKFIMIHLYIGNGKDKTNAALELVMRSPIS